MYVENFQKVDFLHVKKFLRLISFLQLGENHLELNSSLEKNKKNRNHVSLQDFPTWSL